MFRSPGKTIALVIGLTSSLWVSSARADTEGSWYAGIGFGVADIALDATPSVEDKNLSDTAFAVHAGYRFSRHFGIESAYTKLGDYSFTLVCASVCVPEQFPSEVEISGDRLDVSLVGSVPLGERLEAFARLGVATTGFATVTRSFNGAFRSSSSEVSEVYGLGLRILSDGPWSVRLQWDRSRYAKDFTVKLRSDAWSLGAEYRFGS